MAATVLKASAQVTVAVSGTEQPIVAAAVERVVALYLSAPAGNTGVIYVGDSTVTTTKGYGIEKGLSFKIEAPEGNYIDIAQIYVDAGTGGDKVNVSYLQLTN